MAGITSEERFKSEWPTRGPDFNAWHTNLTDFVKMIEASDGLWLVDSDLKYLNLRIDTRTGDFLVFARDDEGVSADRVAKAASEAAARKLNGGYRKQNR